MKIFPPSQKSRTSGFRARNLGKQFSGQPNIYTYQGKLNFESVRPKEKSSCFLWHASTFWERVKMSVCEHLIAC